MLSHARILWQATSSDAYYRFLHANCYLAPIGLAVSFASRSKQQSFIALYAVVAYYFSSKMSRLMILMGPIASILTGVAVGAVLNMTIRQFSHGVTAAPKKPKTSKPAEKATASPAGKGKSRKAAKQAATKKKLRKKQKFSQEGKGILDELGLQAYIDFFGTDKGRNVQLIGGVILLVLLTLIGRVFFSYSHMLAEHMSNPSIIQVLDVQQVSVTCHPAQVCAIKHFTGFCGFLLLLASLDVRRHLSCGG